MAEVAAEAEPIILLWVRIMGHELSAEARGVLLALVELGTIRHFDRAATELAKAGLAELRGDKLAISKEGRNIGRAMRRQTKQLAASWRQRRLGRSPG